MKKHIIVLLVLMGVFSSCEKDYDYDVPLEKAEYVVEGFIEDGLPPIVILTRTQPFFAPIDIDQLEAAFVHDADIRVSNGSNSVQLQEINAQDILSVIDFFQTDLGLDISPEDIELFNKYKDINFYFYTSVEMIGEVGRRYDLSINKGSRSLSATTVLPNRAGLDSIWVTPHPDPMRDTLVLLNIRYSDPANERNFFRYFTQRNRELFYPGYFNSVFDDQSLVDISGKTFNFNLERGYDRNNPDIDLENYMYFIKGDTIRLRWCNIDEVHHKFWSSIEFERTQVGNPFGRPTIVSSNINGGLGIWGGYTATYYELITQ